ncbi:MAG: hypothetical protein HQK71_05645 [Desulfamplus sp.]|nr:hypothetical protein [Desulfamplus sp.]
MPDSNDDSLFSQDDIDKLLNAQSIEEAEESIVNTGEGGDSGDDVIGELSQDDIDRLLNAAAFSEEPEEEPTILDADEPAVEELEDGLSTQDDDEDDDDDLGELSQDDIEKMLNASTPKEADSPIAEVQKDPPLTDSDAFDLISQDDIDKLMSTDDIDISPSESISDMDLDDLESTIEEPSDILNEPSDKEEIDPSEAVSVEQFLITQDTIDGLFAASEQENSSKDFLEDDLDSSPDDPFKVNLSEDEPEFDIGSSDESVGNDLDNLLGDAGDLDDLLNDISQDDIDGFLQDGDSTPQKESAPPQVDSDDSVRNVISQDDIDSLLAGTDEEDEDILADMEQDEDLKASSAAPTVKKVTIPLPEDDNSQVILEELEEPATTLADDSPAKQIAELIKDDEPKKPSKKRFVLKIIMIIFIFLTLLAGSIAGLYFLFFKDKVDQLLPSYMPTPKISDTAEPAKTDNLNMDTEQPKKELKHGTIILDNFVVFTKDRVDGVNYIAVDITVDYSYSTALDDINSKLSYYRAVIYETMNSALKSDEGAKLTESELIEIVKNALNESLPNTKVDKVVFVNFKTG